MTERRATIVAGLAGVVWPVLAVSRVFYSGEIDAPNWQDSPQVVAEFYLSHPLDHTFSIAMASVLVAYLSLVLFISKLSRLVDVSAVGWRWVGRAILALVLIDIAAVSGYVACFSTARQLASTGVTNPDTFAALNGLAWGIYWTDVVIQPAWLALLGLAIIPTALFPRWLGVVLVVTAIVEFGTFFLPAETWNISGLTYLLVLILSVMVLRNPDRYAEERVSSGGKPSSAAR